MVLAFRQQDDTRGSLLTKVSVAAQTYLQFCRGERVFEPTDGSRGVIAGLGRGRRTPFSTVRR